jgi:hypothetical protein
MLRLRYLLANGLAGYLDFCVGTLIAALVCAAFGVHPTLLALALGGVLALLPDFDIVWPILTDTLTHNHHHSLMHRPAFLVPVVACAGWLVAGALGAALAAACVLWHFVHDTPPFTLHNSVAWFWPLQKKLRREPTVGHHEWLERYWLRVSTLLMVEVGAGTLALAAALVIALQAI